MGDVVKWPNTSVCLTDIFAGSNPAVLANIGQEGYGKPY